MGLLEPPGALLPVRLLALPATQVLGSMRCQPWSAGPDKALRSAAAPRCRLGSRSLPGQAPPQRASGP
jgi:hypothetical protein